MIKRILIASCFLAHTAFGVAEGELFPKVEITKTSGPAFSSADLQGKVTVINFWATWCEACKVELKEMQTEFANLLGNENFRFMYVSLDKEPEKAVKWVSENVSNPQEFLKNL